MTANIPRGSLFVVTGSRENAARYIYAHQKTLDRIICFEDELPLYDSYRTMACGSAQDVAGYSEALERALSVLESPNISRIFLRLPLNFPLPELPETVSLHVADADAFPPVIGITGKDCPQKAALLNTLRSQGFRILHSEEIYQNLLHRDSPLIEKFYEVEPGLFNGEECSWEKLNLGNLRILMTRDPLLRSFLTGAIHTHIRHEIVAQLLSDNTPTVIDAPALFEGKLAQFCSITAAVAPQPGDFPHREDCGCVLTNDGDLDAFATKCLAFLSEPGIM